MGLVFDHGCDAFTVGLITIVSMKVVNIGNNALAYLALITTITCFHFATLEEYYAGTLILPVCNGVSDGSILLITVFLATGIFGYEFWAYGVCDGTWT